MDIHVDCTFVVAMMIIMLGNECHMASGEGSAMARAKVGVAMHGKQKRSAGGGNSTLDPQVLASTATCQGFRLAGTREHSSLHGTYLEGEILWCDLLTIYRMYNSVLGKYIYLYRKNGRWLFGDEKCGDTAYMQSSYTGGRSPTDVNSWQEAATGGAWFTELGVSLTCVYNAGKCFSCTGGPDDYRCAGKQYELLTSIPIVYCDLINGYYCWQTYTYARSSYGAYNQVTSVKRECKQGCPSKNRDDYDCSGTCSSTTCSKCCNANDCNNASMIGEGSYERCDSVRQTTTWTLMVISMVTAALSDCSTF